MELALLEKEKIKTFLDLKAAEYEQLSFIEKDPISIPHLFSKLQDVEIAGLFAATLAWGNRTSIIRSCQRLLEMMDHAPYDFILNHRDSDLKPMLSFVHRTFNATDLLYFIDWLKWFYQDNESLETAFFPNKNMSVKAALMGFNELFFSLPDAPGRTHKHVSNPQKKSACKRLNMFLRWMVRKDSPVDFGIWKRVASSELMIPLDTHTGQVSRRLGILKRKQNDWKAVEELTCFLKILSPEDPVRYDYALFALGAEERYRFKKK